MRARFFEVVVRQVHRDTVQPSVGLRVTAKAIESAKGAIEGLLRQVRRVFGVVHHPQEQVVDAPLIGRHERFKLDRLVHPPHSRSPALRI
jgi:hypothetical protein